MSIATRLIKWDRSKPDIPEGGKLLCYSQSEDGTALAHQGYLCKRAIGIADITTNKKANFTLIDTAEGNDHIQGFLQSPNIFLINNGFKELLGGNEDDLFYLMGNNTTGYIDGGNGTNILDVNDFAKRKYLEINLDKNQLSTSTAHQPDLKIVKLQQLSARKKQMDSITCDCDTKKVDGRGGANSTYQDTLLIPFSSSLCFYQLSCMVRPNTVIENKATKGNFFYEVPMDKGITYIHLYNASNEAQHTFNFNYSMHDVYAIDVKRVLSHYQVNFHFMDNTTFVENTEDKFLKVTIASHTRHDTAYQLKDDTKIKVSENTIYAMQNSYQSVREIIRDYPSIVNRLKLPMFIYSSITNSTVSIGYNHHDVMFNNHYYPSHLFGNGGNNTYVITVPEETEPFFQIPSVILYSSVNGNNNTKEILDLSRIIQRIEANRTLPVHVLLRSDNNTNLHLKLRKDRHEYLNLRIKGF